MSITQPSGIGIYGDSHTNNTIKDHRKRSVPCGAVSVSGAVRETADFTGNNGLLLVRATRTLNFFNVLVLSTDCKDRAL